MKTNLKFNHTLYLYTTSNSDHGDPIVSASLSNATAIPCLAELLDGFEGSLNDSDTGTVTLQIAPDTPVYISLSGRLTGMIAQYNRVGTPGDVDFYRVSSVHPGESVISGEADLVELTLTRIETPIKAN